MNYIKAILAILLIARGGTGLYQYASDYTTLSEFGKGYLWGNVAMLILGLGIAYLLWKSVKGSN